MVAAGVFAALGAALSGGGFLLVRFGVRATDLGVRGWMRGWFRRWGLVLIEVLVAAFGVGLAMIAYNAVASGADTSEVVIPLAILPLIFAGVATVEMHRRQAGQGAQYMVNASGVVVFGVLLVVLGATAEDLGLLAAWSVGPILIGLSSLGSARRRGHADMRRLS